MKLFSLNCPNCGASLEIENGVDIFFCKYCGHKIMLAGQSKAAIQAKVQLKSMEHEERLVEKKYAQERYKMEFQKKDANKTFIIYLICLAIVLVGIGIIMLVGNNGAKEQEKKLQTILAEVMVDIENGDYASATIKANSLYWDSSWTNEGKSKWNSTRKSVLKQIEKAQRQAENETTNESKSDNGLFSWFN